MLGFALDKGEDSETISLLSSINNLEGNSLAYKKVRLIDVEHPLKIISEVRNAMKTFENNGYIYFLDHQKTIVSSIFISNIQIIKSKHNNLTLYGLVWRHPKGYQKTLDMRINNELTKKNLWKNLKKDELQGWLLSASHSLKFDTIRENISIQIDGNEFHNLDGFFCTIGEEIHGPAGYFGRNFSAMEDCLRGDFGIKSISELTWINHQRSKLLFKRKFQEILEIFSDHNVKVVLK